jgi:hypothetical protein
MRGVIIAGCQRNARTPERLHRIDARLPAVQQRQQPDHGQADDAQHGQDPDTPPNRPPPPDAPLAPHHRIGMRPPPIACPGYRSPILRHDQRAPEGQRMTRSV